MLLLPIAVAPDDNDTLLVTCRFLPEVTTFAADLVDAREKGRELVEEALGGRLARWEAFDLPEADETRAAVEAGTFVTVSLQATMKVLLFRACKQMDVTRAELARRLGWHREQVDRLFRIDHASRVDQIDAAMAAIGKTFDLEVRPAA
jgi:antitoxin HicB